MAIVGIEAKKREVLGARNVKKIRQQGVVPGVFYMAGKEVVHLAFDNKSLKHFLYHGRGLVDLNIDGEKSARKCVLKSVQYHPVTEDVLHVDFLGVKMGEKFQLAVPVVLTGEPVGEKSGGILQLILRELQIECLPKDIPNQIEIDVSHLDIGDTLFVKDLALENLTILTDPNEAIANVDVTRSALSEMDEAGEEGEGEDGEGVAEETGEEAAE